LRYSAGELIHRPNEISEALLFIVEVQVSLVIEQEARAAFQ